MSDPFGQLGLNRNASESEIKAKYRLLAKKCHPDLNPGCMKSEETFKVLTVAYNKAIGEAKLRSLRPSSPLGGRARPMPSPSAMRRRYGESAAGQSAGAGASESSSRHHDSAEWNRAHYQSEDVYDHAGSRRWNVGGSADATWRRAQRRAEDAQAGSHHGPYSRPHWRAPPQRPVVRKPPLLIVIAMQLTATAGIWAWVASTWH